MRKWKMLFLFSVTMFTTILQAQQIDSMLSVYHDRYQQEKLHLHFDKSIYNKGDTIWFKAYLLAGENLSDYSRSFYADWYDEQGHLIKHTLHPVFESSARGLFEVPVNYTGEVIHLRAYTRWMLNFDTAFLYTKDISITNKETVTKKALLNQAVANIHFFPEGGDLVNGITSTVAFMAVNQSGKPVAVRGAILNNANELVDSFTSVHDGMGSFSLEASAKEQYTCNWIDEYGISHSSTLPAAKNSGAAIEARIINNKAVFSVKRTTDANDNYKLLHVIASINQQLVYKAAINLNNKKTAAGEIPVNNLQTGVLQITVFDANWLPVAERVLFIKNDQYQFFPEVNVVTKRVSKRAKNEIEVHVPDSLLSNLSISVTDADIFNDNSTNIFSQLLLSGDIRGYIHNPAYYFSGNQDSINKQLDLVMLTHGWRRYRWDDIAKGKLPVLPYPIDSDYVQIKGKIFTGGQAGIKANQAITLIMQAKDSSKQYFSLPVKADGSFNQRGIIFFDTARIFYQLTGDKRLNDIASVSFQYGLPLIPYARSIQPFHYWKADSAELRQNNLFYTQVGKTRKDFDSAVVLKEVVVQSKIKSPVDILDEKYTSGLFSNKNGYAFDVINDDRAQASIDIFHYLQNTIPGLSMSLPILGANGAEDANSNNVPGLNWRDGTPDIYVNEIPADASRIMGIQMSDVAYIKVFRPPFMMGSGSGVSGAIAIYTKQAGDRLNQIKGLNNALVSGYSAYKDFYNPDYSRAQSRYPDVRATLYWNPYVLTDKKMKTVKLEFYNNDVTKKFRIILEGVNAAGKLARVEKIVE